MIAKNKVYFIILISVPFMLSQCKLRESHITAFGDVSTPYAPTIVVDSCIEEHQFEGKSSDVFRTIEVGGQVSHIPKWAFAIIPTLEEVKLTPKVKIIDDNAFYSCLKLEKINLDKVEIVGENCFKFSSLENALIKNAIIIKDFAFSNCLKLTTIEFSDKLKSIGEFAFYGDTAIVACNIPSGKIEKCAFMECTNLEYLSLNNISSIGKAAFLGCKKLKEVSINNHDVIIADDAFEKDVVITYK